MKFRVCQNGDSWHGNVIEFEADDAEDAAEKWSQDYFDGGNDPPSDNSFDLVVASPDGAITRIDVTVEWEPSFYPDDRRQEPDPRTVAMLRAGADATDDEVTL
mgnify:CR=1 FL=1